MNNEVGVHRGGEALPTLLPLAPAGVARPPQRLNRALKITNRSVRRPSRPFLVARERSGGGQRVSLFIVIYRCLSAWTEKTGSGQASLSVRRVI